jgi:competence ComEA-like helix-hairpin-helix protein
MSDFHMTLLEPTGLPADKRVRYLTGLVLGVDELRQEQTYFIERDRLHQRALHGYGTVNGLRVTVPPAVDVNGPEVRVTPGLAVDPSGQHICVPDVQCARLDAWLETHRDDVLERVGDLPAPMSLYVVLCYLECETDDVPMPGGPCRSGDDTRAASRIADSFRLQLTLDRPAEASPPADPWLFDPARPGLPERPPHLEEAAVREFGQLLAGLEIAHSGGPYLDEDGLIELVRSLPPHEDEDDAPASPPAGPFQLDPEEAPQLLRAAFRVWITEKRPLILGADRCAAPPDGDDCVLLAELRFEVEEVGGLLRVTAAGLGDVAVIEADRPLVYSTRLLQEMLLQRAGGSAAGPASPPSGDGPPVPPAPPEPPAPSDPLAPGEPGTSVVALSWIHDQPADGFVPVSMPDGTFLGIVVELNGDPDLPADFLDQDTFQLFLRQHDGRGFWYPRAVRPHAVRSVGVIARDGDVIEGAAHDASPRTAVAFTVDETTLEAIGNEEVEITIRGLLRGGDGPGLSGPRFESWFVRNVTRININTATAEELQALPRIGPVLAEAIVDTRDEIGGFTAVEDLLLVSGIGPWLLGVLRPFVTI